MPASSMSACAIAFLGLGTAVETACGSDAGSAGSSVRLSRCGELNTAHPVQFPEKSHRRILPASKTHGEQHRSNCTFSRSLSRTRSCGTKGVSETRSLGVDFFGNRLRKVSISIANYFQLCYPFYVHREFHPRAFQFLVSTHEFFRLLSYTASYF
jgi:hypothetical protein